MEPVIIKKGKKEYTFYADRLEITKNKKVIRTIEYSGIREIMYNPEFGLKDFLYNFLGGLGDHTRDAFTAIMKEFEEIPLCIGISNDDFEKVKSIIPIPIKLL